MRGGKESINTLAKLAGTTVERAQHMAKAIVRKLDGILVPRPDNFTPAQRTPWGGTRILELKKALGITAEGVVGESWEISGHRSFPNLIPLEMDDTHIEVPLWLIGNIAPRELYGPANVAKFGNNPPFLTKLLNSSSTHNLSIQIHPDADYAAKNGAWHSKTEMWVILAAEHGAGLYVGLTPDATEEGMRRALEEDRDISPYLNFVAVHAGDVFFIPAGTPHAIGAGILLLEQQETSETTFRYFSWRDGRELHIDDAIQSTHWNTTRGMVFVDGVTRRQPRVLTQGDGSVAHHELLAAEDEFSFDRVTFKGNDVHEGDASQGMQGLTVTEGAVSILREDGSELGYAGEGQSIIIPSALGGYQLHSPPGTKATVYIGRSDPR